MTDFKDSADDDCAIVKYEGTPTDYEASEEISRWQRFLNAFFPFTRRGGKLAAYGAELSRAYAEAEVASKQNEAAKKAAEAAEIAALAEVNKNESCRIFNAQVDAIFRDDSLPEAAKLLKLAKLLDTNPQLAEQIDRVADLMNRLNVARGTNVEISPRFNFSSARLDEPAT